MSGTLSATVPTNRRISGVTEVTIDGDAYSCTDFSWSPARFDREAMTSLSGYDGYSEKPIVPYIDLHLRDGRNVSVTAFNAKTGSTVVVKLANGKQIVGHNMTCINAQEVSGGEAVFQAKFISDDVYESGISA